MSEQHELEASSAAAPVSGGRWRAIRFVVVFVIAVAVLLGGYRYAIDSQANQRYLFEVARHTSWLLDRAGYSSELEGGNAFKGKEAAIRDEIEALERGEVPPPSFPSSAEGADAPPLTPWELWHYRALRMLHGWGEPVNAGAPPTHPGTLRNQGPVVSFVARPSLAMRLEDAKAELEALRRSEPGNAAALTAQEAVVDRLNAELQARGDTGTAKDPDEKSFRFKVVPDCGAIEVMAIFVAAVLAFPAAWSKRLAGVVLGLPLLYGLNIIRLAVLAFIGAWTDGNEIFDFSHHFVWQGIYVVFVVALWLAWMEFIVRGKREA